MYELKEFAMQWLRVVLATLMVVAFTAFATLPYQLTHHPGEAPAATQTSVWHLT